MQHRTGSAERWMAGRRFTVMPEQNIPLPATPEMVRSAWS
tara:strand:+ start:4736 stop:4855 length:120 start_codon:yes stop_codon:yes gene_type:complete